MDVYLDNELLFSISDDQQSILKHSIKSDILVSEIKRRLQWCIDEPIKQRYREMRAEWEPILIQRGATSLPTDMIAFSKLAMQQPDYKDAATKIAEQEAAKQVKS